MKRFFAALLTLTCMLSLSACREEQAAAKTVIYLYPEEETTVTVKLDFEGTLTSTYPAYEDGWTVSARPDGALTDPESGREYYCLFWEGITEAEYDFSTGFCVAGEDTAAFLEDALARLEEADPALPLADAVADALYAVLSPVVRDGHFVVDNRHLIEPYELSPYYVPGVYIDDPTGLDEDYIKPTIGPDGAITYGFYALSRDGSDLPDTVGEYDGLNWTQCKPVRTLSGTAFSEGQCQGIPMLESHRMYAERSGEEEQLERFASCGGEYAGAPLLIFDVRGNPGGSDRWFMSWFEGWTGQPAQPRQAFGQRYSQLRRQNSTLSYPEEWMGTWGVSSSGGDWVEREGYTFLLTDGGTASSGETVVEHLHSVENTLVVGAPSGGCALVPNNMHLYLPNTGVELYFGTGLCFHDTMENRDGIGYLPDLWVPPVEAPVAVARMCEYYGLRG